MFVIAPAALTIPGDGIYDVHELETGDYWIDHNGRVGCERTAAAGRRQPIVYALVKQGSHDAAGWISFSVDNNSLYLHTAWTNTWQRRQGVFGALFLEMTRRYPWLRVRGIFLSEGIMWRVQAYNNELALTLA